MSSTEQDQEPQETFIEANEVGEVVPEDPDQMEPEEDEDMENIEVDLSNNSYSYFDTHQDSIYCVASHPTLPMVLTGGGDERAYLWTTHSNPTRLVTELSGQKESVVAGGFTFDGQFVVTGDMSGQLRVWKSKSGGQKWEFFTAIQEIEEIVYIKFHPSLPVIAVGAQDGSVWVYELGAKFSQLAVLNGHAAPSTNALFVNTDDHDWLTLISISEDASIICWNVYQSQQVYSLGRRELRGEHPWVSICASPSGKTVAVGAMDGTLAILKVEDGSLLHKLDTLPNSEDLESRSVEGIAWSDKTGLLATGNVSGLVQLWSPANWKVRASFNLQDAVTGLQFIPGQPTLVVSGMDDTISVYDALSGKEAWKGLGHSAGVLGFVAQDNNGQLRLVSSDDAGIALVFEVDLNQERSLVSQ